MSHMRTWTSTLVVSAALAVAPNISGAQIQDGVDRPGMDLAPGFEIGADPALCKKACDANAQCKAWTYVKPGYQGTTARCWLKSAVPDAVRNKCCTSGVRENAPSALTPIQLPTPGAQPQPGNAADQKTLTPIQLPRTPDAIARPLPQPPSVDSRANGGYPIVLRCCRGVPATPALPSTIPAMSLGRADMLGALMASQITREELERLSMSARMSTTSLVTTTLSGTVVETAKTLALHSLPTFGQLWDKPVTVTVINEAPSFTRDERAYRVGAVELTGAYFPVYGDIKRAVEWKMLTVQPGAAMLVLVDLPVAAGQYMIGIQAVAGGGEGLIAMPLEESPKPFFEASVGRSVAGVWAWDALAPVSNSAGTAQIALWAAPGPLDVQPVQASGMHGHTALLWVQFKDYANVYGVTITRL